MWHAHRQHDRYLEGHRRAVSVNGQALAHRPGQQGSGRCWAADEHDTHAVHDEAQDREPPNQCRGSCCDGYAVRRTSLPDMNQQHYDHAVQGADHQANQGADNRGDHECKQALCIAELRAMEAEDGGSEDEAAANRPEKRSAKGAEVHRRAQEILGHIPRPSARGTTVPSGPSACWGAECDANAHKVMLHIRRWQSVTRAGRVQYPEDRWYGTR
jgi:hypothetical protein